MVDNCGKSVYIVYIVWCMMLNVYGIIMILLCSFVCIWNVLEYVFEIVLKSFNRLNGIVMFNVYR